ncbi:arylsulfatase B [Diachasma alloeum]|uniref:arylsulfatase B n=1 Tax=Diachasma alloeum TaxID=454923 RepID=UPI0007381BEB|nr:arylsulfatase B [Diachasma alloeum]
MESYSPRICVAFLLGTFLASSSGQFPASPNIIVFMVDDMGWNDVGFHESNEIPTPNIDALAYNGIILNRHYVLPSCTPARAAFFTGLYPIRMGLQGDSLKGSDARGLPLNIRILPEYLRELGYSTRLVGKWHLGFPTPQFTPQHRGFDSFLGFYNDHISQYKYYYRDGNMSGFDLQRGDGPAHDIRERYVTRVFTEEAIRIIERHDPKSPLYLQINHLGFHAPLEPPHDGYFGGYRYQNFSYLHGERRKYAMMVSEIDTSLGSIVSALGDRALLNDSIIVFLTDNGAPTGGAEGNAGSNWPLRGGKYSLYEGGVRGVAAIWSPRLRRMAQVSNNLMHITDWLPTLYRAAGGNVRDLGDVDGIDYWDHFSRDTEAPRQSLLINIDERKKTEAAIFRRYKLIRGHSDEGNNDYYFGSSGKNVNVPAYDYNMVHSSAVVSAIHSHLGHPIVPQSGMSKLREQARVSKCLDMRLFRINGTNPCRNETECLFDIVQDPCEVDNIARLHPKIVRELDSILERYGNMLTKQPNIPTNWNADPRRHNSTWVPWLHPNLYESRYGYNGSAATVISTLAVCVHIGMVLLIVGLRAFL